MFELDENGKRAYTFKVPVKEYDIRSSSKIKAVRAM